MKLNEEQLRYIIDEHVENVLNEWFGSQLWNGAKNFAQSEFVQNVGNMISPGYGDRINSFANGDWKNAKRNAKRRPSNDDLLKKYQQDCQKKDLFKKYQQYCQKKGIDPNDEASRKQFLNDNK